MNTTWLWHDPVLRTVPRWIVWSLATTLLLLGFAVSLGLYVERTQGRALSDLVATALFGLVLWLPAVILLLSRASRIRCSSFDLSLPFSVHRLWMRHVIATALSGSLLILAIGSIASVVLYLLGFYTETPLPLSHGSYWKLVPTLIVFFALAVTWAHAAFPGNVALPATRAQGATRLLLGLAVFGLAVLWTRLPLISLLLPLWATWQLMRWAGNRLPATWSLEAQKSSATATAPTRQGDWEEAAHPGKTWGGLGWQLFLLRTLHSGTPKAGMTLWVGVPLLLGFGMILAGAFFYMGDEEIRWTMLAITIYMLFALYSKPLAFLHSLDALPLSRRHLFALLTLPSLVVLAAGYGAGRLLVAWKDPGLQIRALQTCAGVGVPAALHEIAWDGTVEPVVAPWGESHVPYTAPLVKGWKPVVVSRFCTRDSNVSMEYQIFQARLAAGTVYGQTPSDDELGAFLSASDRPAPRFLETTLPSQLPGERGVFPILLAILCVGTFGAMAIYLRTFRVGRRDRLRKIVFVGFLAFFLTVHLGQFIAFALGLTTLWAWDVLWQSGTRSIVAALPGGILGLWLLVGLLVGVTYRMAARQFERAELPISRGEPRC